MLSRLSAGLLFQVARACRGTEGKPSEIGVLSWFGKPVTVRPYHAAVDRCSFNFFLHLYELWSLLLSSRAELRLISMALHFRID